MPVAPISPARASALSRRRRPEATRHDTGTATPRHRAVIDEGGAEDGLIRQRALGRPVLKSAADARAIIVAAVEGSWAEANENHHADSDNSSTIFRQLAPSGGASRMSPDYAAWQASRPRLGHGDGFGARQGFRQLLGWRPSSWPIERHRSDEIPAARAWHESAVAASTRAADRAEYRSDRRAPEDRTSRR